MEQVLEFLTELAKNNNRDWFNANKDRYNTSKEKILFLTEVLINEIGKFDSSITGTSPKDCIFRIFRDVRFSPDKRPYKTNFGSFIAKGGRKSMAPGYYFHIEPEQSFIGGGIYMPPAEPLKLVRSYLAEHAEEFLDVANDPGFKAVFPEMYDHKLKTAPKGFDKEHEYIGLLRYKSFVFSQQLNKKTTLSDNLIDHMVQSFGQLYRINRILGDALEGL